jgi:hypothetical protein
MVSPAKPAAVMMTTGMRHSAGLAAVVRESPSRPSSASSHRARSRQRGGPSATGSTHRGRYSRTRQRTPRIRGIPRRLLGWRSRRRRAESPQRFWRRKLTRRPNRTAFGHQESSRLCWESRFVHLGAEVLKIKGEALPSDALALSHVEKRRVSISSNRLTTNVHRMRPMCGCRRFALELPHSIAAFVWARNAG